jgi:hypothetical protein
LDPAKLFGDLGDGGVVEDGFAASKTGGFRLDRPAKKSAGDLMKSRKEEALKK